MVADKTGMELNGKILNKINLMGNRWLLNEEQKNLCNGFCGTLYVAICGWFLLIRWSVCSVN